MNESPLSLGKYQTVHAFKVCKKEVEKHLDENRKIVLPYIGENIMVGIQIHDKSWVDRKSTRLNSSH